MSEPTSKLTMPTPARAFRKRSSLKSTFGSPSSRTSPVPSTTRLEAVIASCSARSSSSAAKTAASLSSNGVVGSENWMS